MVKFNLYPGAGYWLTPFAVEDANVNNLDEGLELLAKKLIEDNETAYFLTVEEFESMCNDLSEEERGYLDEQYIYIDGTCNGARFPIYINALNMSIN